MAHTYDTELVRASRLSIAQFLTNPPVRLRTLPPRRRTRFQNLNPRRPHSACPRTRPLRLHRIRNLNLTNLPTQPNSNAPASPETVPQTRPLDLQRRVHQHRRCRSEDLRRRGWPLGFVQRVRAGRWQVCRGFVLVLSRV